MAQLIKNAALVTDDWTSLELAEGELPESISLPVGQIIFPLSVWRARKEEIIARRQSIGLLLQPDEPAELIKDDIAYFALIAINFPKFVDGRGYSTASLLRQRFGYRGELRAVGDVLHDQLFFMQRVGFDAFAFKDGKDVAQALQKAFSSFSDTYQTSTSQPLPYFRRRA